MMQLLVFPLSCPSNLFFYGVENIGLDNFLGGELILNSRQVVLANMAIVEPETTACFSCFQGSNKKFSLSSKSGTLLPEFPEARKLELPDGVSAQKVHQHQEYYKPCHWSGRIVHTLSLVGKNSTHPLIRWDRAYILPD